MAKTTSIEWSDATWQIITGCSVLSPGCKRCYAMKLAGGRLRNHPSRQGLTIGTESGPVWTGEVRFNEAWFDQPLEWKQPLEIFVCAHGDLFHEGVPDAWLDRVFHRMESANWHIYKILTKRSDRQKGYVANRYGGATAPAHLQFGVSVEDRARRYRMDDLRETKAAVRFLSLEPLLEDLGEFDLTGIHQVIVGGESQPGARPMHPDWVRSVRDQCIAAGVPFFFKQWGNCSFDGAALALTRKAMRYRMPDGTPYAFVSKGMSGRHLDGRTWDERPKVAT